MKLVSIGDGHTLQENAALSVARMRRDGAPKGPINSSTRSFATQADWYKNKGKPGYPKYADDPNKSKHVWRPADKNDKGARALDVNDPLRSWMIKYGARYGWIRTISVEPWHFEYHESRDKFLNQPLQKETELSWSDTSVTTNPITNKPVTTGYALQIASHYAYRGWELEIKQRAQIDNLIGAVAALSKGEQFDEQKLLNGVKAAAKAGAAEATAAILATVEDVLREQADINADEILDALKARL